VGRQGGESPRWRSKASSDNAAAGARQIFSKVRSPERTTKKSKETEESEGGRDWRELVLSSVRVPNQILRMAYLAESDDGDLLNVKGEPPILEALFGVLVIGSDRRLDTRRNDKPGLTLEILKFVLHHLQALFSQLLLSLLLQFAFNSAV
jgi:hypothetical protein